MSESVIIRQSVTRAGSGEVAVGQPCLLVIFGASGDLTKRLLMPALFNLYCDRRLAPQFAVIGMALEELTTEQFRERLTADLPRFSTRKPFDLEAWKTFARKLYYLPGNFSDLAAFQRLANLADQLDQQYQTGGNLIFYMAVPPAVFGLLSNQLSAAGFNSRPRGWIRLVIEKPFGHDLASARELNRAILAHWSEDQVYRIDHYLGKETVQNLLVFRFSNGIFEPLWNNRHVDHIQFTVAETVGVENRGQYYDQTGALRDMVQSHMFQMVAYLCMEPPGSFRADAVRNEKSKLLDSVRILKPEEVRRHVVRGQYGPGIRPDGTPAVGYRQEPDVHPQSATETFVALRLFIDNWRWHGVPIYLRSGKALWKRDTEIVVQFKKAPEVLFRDIPTVARLDSNKLIFHMQPDQGIELRFHAKVPGPTMLLQNVTMRFDYEESFEAARGTGYEVLLYNAMIGDATLFSRTDLVESAWRIAQPILEAWGAEPPSDFPNYSAGSWGPKASFDLIEQDGRRWVEVLTRDVLQKVPLFGGCDPTGLHHLAMVLEPDVFEPGDVIFRKGEPGTAMYVICRGQVEILDGDGVCRGVLREGDYFGELSLLLSQPRIATARALTRCDIFVLEKDAFVEVLKAHPKLAQALREAATERYQLPNW
ncbi:MAG: glucose-6-phosphate dehydrogenase [Gemmataceae bacterium]|nr:glucose-6-phosphate dehydrogenase [Gemmataceae bacterium]MDW8264815.1 glucose-6-phosphate dehydrogenase [Gemmataceae bacterium]